MFKSVAHLSFDLRNNQFETLSADVFYNTTEQAWEQTGTKVIKGILYRCLLIVKDSTERHMYCETYRIIYWEQLVLL